MSIRLFATAAIGTALLIAAAHAQNSPSSMSPSSSSSSMSPSGSSSSMSPSGSSTQNSSSAQATQNIPREIKQKLSQDGFTNVQVVPGSYLVSAKDKNGDPVMMVIGPHSMTIMSEFPGSRGTATTGSSSGSSSTGSSGSSGLSNGQNTSSPRKIK